MQGSAAVRAIKERLNIVSLISRYVELKPNGGGRWIGPCPFHKETKGSFTVNEEWGMYYCFGCQAKGDIFDFYSQINGLDFRSSLEALAQEAGITLDSSPADHRQKKERDERQIMLKMHDYAAKVFARNLSEKMGEACRAYIAKRGLSEDIVSRFGLGWAAAEWENLRKALQAAQFPMDLAIASGLLGQGKNGFPYDRFRSRLMFPIRSFPNKIVAFGGRIIEAVDEAKYVNSSDSPIYKKGEHLYGLVQASQAIRNAKYALLTEGYMDVLTLHQFGYPNAVGVLGTSLTEAQIDRVTRSFTSRLALLFDGDGAGQKAAVRACEMILPKGLACSVIILPDGEDIDSLLRLPKGKEIFDSLLEKAPRGLEFYARHLRELAPREMIVHAQQFLRKIESAELYSLMATNLSNLLGISELALRNSTAASAAFVSKESPQNETSISITERQVLMFAVRYPEQRDLLVELGADLALRSDAAKAFWAKLEERGDCVDKLTPQERLLWEEWRGRLAPPLGKHYEQELAALKLFVKRFQMAENQALVTEVLRQNAGQQNAAQEKIFLEALQHALMEQNK